MELIRTARALKPDDAQALLVMFNVALEGQDLPQAGAALHQLESLIPGDVRVQDRRARLLSAEGHTAEAIALLQPSWKRLSSLARMEYRHGEISMAKLHLEQLLSRAPDNLDGLSLLAEVELASGDPENSVALYQRLVSRSPDTSKLTNLGLAYLMLRRYPEAAKACGAALEREPRNPFFALNLADAYMLLGKREEAARLYGRVLDLIDSDVTARNSNALLTRAQALAHLGKGPEAVAAVQEALRLAPDGGAEAYAAALVYTILGEDESALMFAGQAVRRGFMTPWFGLPWFDRLRSRPEFPFTINRDPDRSQ
jgi:tetratricopeptide (TPR) repeat protein